MQELSKALGSDKLLRFYLRAIEQYGDIHLKELSVEEVGPNREMVVGGQQLINFGFDSFLGLDQHPQVKAALGRGAKAWGTQFGASRAFAACGIESELERKIARWMGTEAAVIFPSVTLTNVGALPGLVSQPDIILIDEYAHNSIQEGTRIAKANGVRVIPFKHNDAAELEKAFLAARPYRCAVVAIDGIYSMSGAVAAMPELNAVAMRHNAVLYIDDAHATGVFGEQGRGTVLESLGSYDNTLVVGCLSKACSVFGAFVACTEEFQRLVKYKSNTYIFGGPVPPPYLEAVSTVVDILMSDEYYVLRAKLDANIERMVTGLAALDLVVLGGRSPIVSILVGHEEQVLRAGKFLFDRGYYVQSVAFPAVPFRSAVLRIQVNSNHQPEAIEGLLEALADLKACMTLPSAEEALALSAAAAR